ncbi:lytic transglycosylase domain-containing protein [bacterium]|nr:lytic transglycosylase domain-containing protein [bacterium]
MFSGKIQGLINSSSEANAAKRAEQLNQYVENLNKVANKEIQQEDYFKEILKSSEGVASKFKLSQPFVNTPIMTEAQEEVEEYLGNSDIKPTKNQILDLVSKISEKYDMDEDLVNAVIRQESGFKTDAVSSAGAQGLMQLMPQTAKALGVKDAFNPVQNIEGGVKYLKNMMDKYNGNVILALAAYNAGPGNVDKYNGVPPFKETQNYVKNILANYLK